MVGKIATGEIDENESNSTQGKNPAAVLLGSKGGKARAAGLSPDQRKEIAKRAAKSRWSKRK
jgi:hypothetical protein